MKKRRAQILVLSLLFALCTPAPLALAEATKTESAVFFTDDFSWSLQEDGTACIVKYTGEEENLSIPESLDGHSVTAIGKTAACYNLHLTSVTIPDSVVSVGENAFYGCPNLVSVLIPDSVRTMDANPFGGCSRIKNLRVSSEHPWLEQIDGVLFSKEDRRLVCYPCGLESENYVIPEGIRTIGDYAFCGCKTIVSVTIPDSVVGIGDYAFLWCDSLTKVLIPESVKSLGINPFRECRRLTEIWVSPEHSTLATIGGVLFSKADRQLVSYPCGLEAEDYVIPEGIQIIGEYAFCGCEKLASVTIPDSVTSLGSHAFSDTGLTVVMIPESVTTIGDYTFLGCSNLVSVTILGKVTTISNYMFSGCGNLISVIIPEGVTTIGVLAFNLCENLVSVTIPDGVTGIGNGAFYRCYNLVSVTIPDSVKSIGENAFSSCSVLNVTVERNSYAAQYCKENGIPYDYPDSNDWLNG